MSFLYPDNLMLGLDNHDTQMEIRTNTKNENVTLTSTNHSVPFSASQVKIQEFQRNTNDKVRN